jgi:hypothetical protein
LSCDPPRPATRAPALDAQGMDVREWLASIGEVDGS